MNAMILSITDFFNSCMVPEPELWVNEEKMLTIREGSQNIKVKGRWLNDVKNQVSKGE